MREALAALAALAALGPLATAAAPADDALPAPSYLTVLQKGVSWAEPGEFIGPLYIPDGQCSGVLDHLLRCEAGGAPLSVRVRVQDGAPARVALDASLQRASVLRAACTGEAQVDLHVACAR